MDAHLDRDTQIALYFAYQLQEQNEEVRRQLRAAAIHPAARYAYDRLRELYWTLTRTLGLDGAFEGSPPPRSYAQLRSAAPTAEAGASGKFSFHPNGRIFLDVTPTLRFGAETGIQRVVGEIARRAFRGGLALPVIVDDGNLLPYYDDPALPSRIRIERGDTFVSLDANWGLLDEYLPIVEQVEQAGAQLITVVYDLIPLLHPLSVDPQLSRKFRQWFERFVLRSDAVMCISRTTAQDFAAYVARNDFAAKANLPVGWWRLGADFDEAVRTPVSPRVRSLTAEETPFFLSVGTLEPRKGYPVALAAFDRLWQAGSNARYVILGRRGWQSDCLEQALQQHPEFGRRLIWLDDAGDADLRHCYRNARALVYPSTVEGYGLPMAEASRHGLPVIASDIPIFREISGANVRFFDLLDSAHLALEIEAMLLDPPPRAAPSVNSWDDSAENFVDIVLNGSYQTRLRRPEPALCA